MLSNTDSVVINIDQINESSGSNMLVSTDRIHEIRSLINEIRESWNQTEKITKKYFENIQPHI